MLYGIVFYSDHVRLEFMFLYYKEYKYEDIKVVLCRPKHIVLTVYKKSSSRLE